MVEFGIHSIGALFGLPRNWLFIFKYLVLANNKLRDLKLEMNNVYEKGEFFTPTQVTMFQQLELICCFRPHGIVEMNFETF